MLMPTHSGVQAANIKYSCGKPFQPLVHFLATGNRIPSLCYPKAVAKTVMKCSITKSRPVLKGITFLSIRCSGEKARLISVLITKGSARESSFGG
ncbi:hypothetical protein NPIL_214071 [Nephila pilipes]|uniref:Uncharacterized protein n=1 Tax=Nephila pilipes TaxID=299642 RepID=A0A8X6TSJ7_NEPPI|nr:hypothetical protein NPIL_214071 [Nephila pilipes]